jgi:4-aminobutyrate--pyruvate transaminase
VPNSPFARDIANVLHPTTDLARHRKDGAHIIVKARGITVTDIDGKDYIEGMAGLWCAALGFGEEELVKTAADAMRGLSFYHNFGAKAVVPVIDLAEKLNAIAPFASSKAFFVNSGSEANDTQIKLARYYNNARGKPQKKKIISRHRSYHGVTLATAGLTGIPVFRDGFDVADPNILHTDCPHYYRYGEADETEEAFADRLARNLEQLIEREGADTIAAFIAEPVMGGGGVIVPPRMYFEKVQRILRAHDILFIADEVICGFGRTGRMFGCETFGITPDTMTLAKGLSSAHLPIAAVLIPEEMYNVLIAHSERHGVFGHGYTYGGHPVCAAVALRNIQLMEERNILGHIATVAPVFQQRLKSFGDHPLIGHTRGVGLIGGLEFVADKKTKQQFAPAAGVAAYCVRRCLEHGLITRTVVGDTIAFSPPLIIQPDEVDEMFRRFGKALDETEIWVREQGLRS